MLNVSSFFHLIFCDARNSFACLDHHQSPLNIHRMRVASLSLSLFRQEFVSGQSNLHSLQLNLLVCVVLLFTSSQFETECSSSFLSSNINVEFILSSSLLLRQSSSFKILSSMQSILFGKRGRRRETFGSYSLKQQKRSQGLKNKSLNTLLLFERCSAKASSWQMMILFIECVFV